jgi:hypothetical protein
MDTMRPMILVCLEIAAVLAAAPVCLGCAAGASATNGPSPALAFAAGENDLGECSVGRPRVLATRAAPPVGVSARVDASHLWVRFAPTTQNRVTMSIDPASLDVVEVVESTAPSIRSWAGTAPSGDDDAEAWATGRRGETFVWLDGGRSLQAWTEGSLETALHVEVQTLDRGGAAFDSPFAVEHDGSAVGTPALAVGSSGRGVLAFIESNGHGFQLVAAPVDCSTLR